MRPHGNTNEGPLVCRGRSYPTTPPNPAIRVGAINPKFLAKKYFSPSPRSRPQPSQRTSAWAKEITKASRLRTTTRSPGTLAIFKKFFSAYLRSSPHMPGTLHRGLDFEESLPPIALLTTGTRQDEPHRGTNMGDPLV